MRRRSAGNGFGPTPITWTELDAYSRLSGLRLLPWEIEIIELLDDVLLASEHEQEADEL